MRFMVGEPPIQLRSLSLGESGGFPALCDAVPQRLYQIELFFQTELASLVKKGCAHEVSIACLRFWPNLVAPFLFRLSSATLPTIERIALSPKASEAGQSGELCPTS